MEGTNIEANGNVSSDSDGDGIDFVDEENESSSNESWTTSEDNSSGNEYSVKTKAEKIEELEKELKMQKKSKKKKKKKHRKHKKKHKKHKHKKRLDTKGDEETDDEEKSKKHKKYKSKHKKKSHSDLSEDEQKEDTSSEKEKASKSKESKDLNSNCKSDGKSSRSRSRSRSSHMKRHSRSSSKHRSRSRHRSRRKSRSRSRHRSHSRHRSRSNHRSRNKHRSRSRSHSRSKRQSRSRYRSRSKHRSKSRDRSRNRHRSSSRHSSKRSRRGHSHSRYRSRSRGRSRNRSHTRSRSRSHSKSCRRKSSKSKSDNEKIESKNSLYNFSNKVLSTDEVFSRFSSSTLKKDINIKIDTSKNNNNQERKENRGSSLLGKWEPAPKVNKDVLNYTKLCAEISAGKEDSGRKEKISHPYDVKETPLPLPYHLRVPTNPAQAIMAGTMLSLVSKDEFTGPIEKHFPVSSGVDHREHESNEEIDKIPLYEAATESTEKVNVSSVVARRLGAQQILNSNPDDYSAQLVLADCDQKLKIWSAQNKKPGKFTGERGIRMQKKEIAGEYETWVRKDFFHNLQPVSGGIGMKMMQQMGWRQGQPLGKNNEGFTAPIAFDVKVGRGGLYSADEGPPTQNNHRTGLGANKKPGNAYVPNVNGKHPVSLLSEMAIKNRWGIPEYQCVFEAGKANNKNFLMKVTLQNIDYQPAVASTTKKHAKASAAYTALKILGIAKD